MNEWSRSRKRVIFLIVLLAFLVLVGLPAFYLFYRAPTCFDGRQNGRETGVDCGGSCQLLCRVESLPLINRGDPRLLNLNNGLFELVAKVENPNLNASIYRAKYTFTIYSASSAIPIKVIEGESYIPKGATFAVFEGPFEIEGGTLPSRVTFSWDSESLIWANDTLPTPELSIKSSNFSREDTRPRLDATLDNTSLETVSNVELVALVLGLNSNIFAASKTFVERISPGESVPVVFTWPGPFKEGVVNTEIIIRILPDGSFFR